MDCGACSLVSTPTYTERVDVIGNPAFLKFVEQLEKDEDIALETFDLKEPLVITTIEVDQEKLDRDIAIPVISPILARKKTLAEEIEALDVSKFVSPKLPRRKATTRHSSSTTRATTSSRWRSWSNGTTRSRSRRRQKRSSPTTPSASLRN